jgi:hypothetical protein
MKRVFTAKSLDDPRIGRIKDLLEQEKILCMIRNETISVAMGEIPYTECLPEIWIMNDEDFRWAQKVVDACLDADRTADTENLEPWTCSKCKEEIEGQFTSCWKAIP